MKRLAPWEIRIRFSFSGGGFGFLRYSHGEGRGWRAASRHPGLWISAPSSRSKVGKLATVEQPAITGF
jgi:hypothetical protein